MVVMIRIHLLLFIMLMASVASAEDKCTTAHKDVVSACRDMSLPPACDSAVTFCLTNCTNANSSQHKDCIKRKRSSIETQAPGLGGTLTFEDLNVNKTPGVTGKFVLSPTPRVTTTLDDPYNKRTEDGAGLGVSVTIQTGKKADR